MATKTGLVQEVKLVESLNGVFVYIGSDPSSTDLFLVVFNSGDTDAELQLKRVMVHLLLKAQMAGFTVSVTHDSGSSAIMGLTLIPIIDISPVGQPIHGDYFAISGYGIPDDAEMVFESAAGTQTVVPDFVRPHVAIVSQLPTTIATGRNLVNLQSGSWSSDQVPVDVSDGPALTIRTLYSGDPKTEPYTIVFVANVAIESSGGGSFSADPVLSDRPSYQDAAVDCLLNIFTMEEELMRVGDLDRHIRLVSIFDTTLTVDSDNSLAHAIEPNKMETRRTNLDPYVIRYGEQADIVFVMHGSTTYDRATAWYTTDDLSRATTSFTYDGTSYEHGHYPDIPGSAAIPISFNTTGLTPIHEFGHAASDFNTGRVNDLYVDGSASTALIINKKFRAASTDPVPANFGTYNGTNYTADSARDSLGYPATWTSYHPTLIVATRPNMMDNYWLAPVGEDQLCRLDNLTYDWFRDRLTAKVYR